MGSTHIFTDGSKTEVGAAAAFCALWLNSHFFYLARKAWSGELFAVKDTIRWAEEDSDS